jgi:hypothetical protein
MNKALVIGISKYPSPITPLPAVAADVREVGSLLGSSHGSFQGQPVAVLTDGTAVRDRVIAEFEQAFMGVGPDDTLFVYMAGHGAIGADKRYYFVAHDTQATDVPGTGVPLARVKQFFDACTSRRVFLWLDFCHSGGILARRLTTPAPDDREAISRVLEVVRGHGKVIVAACTPEQSAYEDPTIGHGLFTAFLLEGLRGAAAYHGEVTASSLYDFIDRRMGSDRQRPMWFGHMTGRIVLMHYPAGSGAAVKGMPSEPADVVAENGGSRVDSSGNWCMLGSNYFPAQSVRRDKDGSVVVKITSDGAETDAAISRLKPDRYGQTRPIPYAYRNDAMLARVANVESESVGDEQVWTLTLKEENVQYGGGLMEMALNSGGRHLSADDIAKLRAGRILLNDPPAASDRRAGHLQGAFEESFIRGVNVPVPATDCVLQTVYRQHGSADATFLQTARLAAIFVLKASGVCEQVLELRLGPVANGKCHVKFRGRRQAQFQNVEPATLTLEGDCQLD